MTDRRFFVRRTNFLSVQGCNFLYLSPFFFFFYLKAAVSFALSILRDGSFFFFPRFFFLLRRPPSSVMLAGHHSGPIIDGFRAIFHFFLSLINISWVPIFLSIYPKTIDLLFFFKVARRSVRGSFYLPLRCRLPPPRAIGFLIFEG